MFYHGVALQWKGCNVATARTQKIIREESTLPERSNNQNIHEVLEKVAQALDGLRFGEVVIKVQGGKVIFVDRHERERVG